MEEMKKYRRFDNIDWDGYAGAESFSKGKDPFIYTRVLNSGLVILTIIADKNGLELYLLGDDEDMSVWDKPIPQLTSIRAEGELKHLIDYLEQWDYAPDIAYELDHPSDDVTEGFDCTM